MPLTFKRSGELTIKGLADGLPSRTPFTHHSADLRERALAARRSGSSCVHCAVGAGRAACVAGYRLVLHGLASEMLYELLTGMKRSAAKNALEALPGEEARASGG